MRAHGTRTTVRARHPPSVASAYARAGDRTYPRTEPDRGLVQVDGERRRGVSTVTNPRLASSRRTLFTPSRAGLTTDPWVARMLLRPEPIDLRGRSVGSTGRLRRRSPKPATGHCVKIIIDNIIRNTKIGQKLITYYQKIQKLSQADSIKKLESITPLANTQKNLKEEKKSLVNPSLTTATGKPSGGESK